MKLTKFRIALGLALAGSFGVANAATSIVENHFTETETSLSAKWTVSGTPGSFSTSHDGAYWDVSDLYGYLDYLVATPFGSFQVDISNIEAYHDEPPHIGENPTGPVFSPANPLTATAGNSAFVSLMAPHNGGAWQTAPEDPNDWGIPHWDYFKFKLTSNTDGTANLYLTALHPVPEPGTYAMLLAGLGLMGFIVRRRESDEA